MRIKIRSDAILGTKTRSVQIIFWFNKFIGYKFGNILFLNDNKSGASLYITRIVIHKKDIKTIKLILWMNSIFDYSTKINYSLIVLNLKNQDMRISKFCKDLIDMVKYEN